MSKEELNLDYQAAYDVWKSTIKEGNYLLAVKSALEKHIPKRINEYNRCPCCDTYNETIEKRKNTVTYDICYCWHCGQALDWSDTE